MKTDLHIHSHYSDGTSSVKELKTELLKNNVKLASLTDHDSFEGVKSLEEELKDTDIRLIKGIEITSSVMYENTPREVHILGYNIDLNNKLLNEVLEYNRKQREIEYEFKTNKAYEEGLIKCDFKKVKEEHKYTSNIFVYHIMVSAGHKKFTTESINDFKKNILKLKDTKFEEVGKTIEAIKNAGGIAVLAHPKRTIKKTNLPMEYFLNFPFDGIEVYYQNHNKEDEIKYLNVAKENNLLVTGGSDYHADFAGYPASLGDCSMNEKEIEEFLKRI